MLFLVENFIALRNSTPESLAVHYYGKKSRQLN